MTFVVTENCIKCKYTDCVDVCPVDCFREGDDMLVIDPDECIDCWLCESECPANAIFQEDDVPHDQKCFIHLNAELAKVWPPITEIKKPSDPVDQWNGVAGKLKFLSVDLGTEMLEEIRYIRSDSLSTSDIENGLHHTNLKIRLASYLQCDETMFIAHLETCLQDPSPEIRSLASQKTLLSEGHITTLFADSDAGVRASIAEQPILTDAQLEQGLSDSSPVVRKAFYLRENNNTSLFERALSDPDECVRISVINRNEFTPTEAQFIRSLYSKFNGEVAAMLSKVTIPFLESIITIRDTSLRALAVRAMLEKHGNDLSPDKVDRIIADPSVRVRATLAANESFRLSTQQVETLLEDASPTVRATTAKRSDITPTELQIKNGLGDNSPQVRDAFFRFSRKATPDVQHWFQEYLSGDNQIIMQDPCEDKVGELLKAILSYPTWTKQKHKLSCDLHDLVEKEGYLIYKTDQRSHLARSITGQSFLYQVPNSQKGNLKVFRGKRIRILSLGSGPYSSAIMAAKEI